MYMTKHCHTIIMYIVVDVESRRKAGLGGLLLLRHYALLIMFVTIVFANSSKSSYSCIPCSLLMS